MSVCFVELHDELVFLHNGVGDVAQLPAQSRHGFFITHYLDIASFQLLASGSLSDWLKSDPQYNIITYLGILC